MWWLTFWATLYCNFNCNCNSAIKQERFKGQVMGPRLRIWSLMRGDAMMSRERDGAEKPWRFATEDRPSDRRPIFVRDHFSLTGNLALVGNCKPCQFRYSRTRNSELDRRALHKSNPTRSHSRSA